MSRGLIIGIAVLSILAVGADVRAAATTGSLRGLVTDAGGTPVQSIEVELSGEGIASRSMGTDEAGRYTFPLLPPGRYRLAVRRNHVEVTAQIVTIPLGTDTRQDFRVGTSYTAGIVVSGAVPQLHTSNAHVATNISAEEFGLLPTTRDFQQLTTIAPGVLFDTRNESSPTVSGSTHLENDYVIDGVSTRDPRYGSSATNLTMNFVEEIQIITMNASAEYARSTGGIFNVITRSGGGQLTGELSTYFANAGWASDNITSVFRGSSTRTLGRDKRDYTASLGGPLLRDRAWFYGAFGPRHETIPVELFDSGLTALATRERVRDETVYAGKITFAAAPSHALTLSAFGNPIRNAGWQGDVLWDETAARYTKHSGTENIALRYLGAISDRSWVEATAGRHAQHLYTEADTETGRNAPFQIDYTSNTFGTFIAHGGILRGGREDARRRFLSLRATHVLGRHELRAGLDEEENRYDSFWTQSYYGFFGPRTVPGVGRRDVMNVWVDAENGWGTNDQLSSFLEDRIRLGNVTVTVGLRWEQQTIGSAKGVTIVDAMAPNGALSVSDRRNFTFEDNWAPRLGVAWDPRGSGRAKLFAAAGRYFEAIPLNVNVAFLNGFRTLGKSYYSAVPQNSQTWFNSNGSPLNADWIAFDTYDLHHHDAIDPSIKLQYEDQFSAGGELQLGTRTVVGMRVVSRRLGRVIDDRGNWNESNLRARPTSYLLINPGEGTYGSAFRRPQRNHTAVELTLHRRLAERWQLFASYVAARSRGNYDGLVEYSSTQFTTPAPNTGHGFDLARLEANSFGRLRGDRPYQFKVHSSYTLPFGLTLSQAFLYSAGIPISAFTAPGLSQGKRAYYLTPRGSEGRTPDHWMLDLHSEYVVRLPVSWQGRVSVVADVYNVTDNHEVLEVDEAYVVPGMAGFELWTAASNRDEWGFPRYREDLPASPFYKTPRLYQAPRAIQVGLRLRF